MQKWRLTYDIDGEAIQERMKEPFGVDYFGTFLVPEFPLDCFYLLIKNAALKVAWFFDFLIAAYVHYYSIQLNEIYLYLVFYYYIKLITLASVW